MTEKEFWKYFRSTTITREQAMKGEYKEEQVPLKKIVEMGELLLLKNVTLKAKQIIVMTLAHSPTKAALTILKAYNKAPDKELKIFAELALDECKMWNER